MDNLVILSVELAIKLMEPRQGAELTVFQMIQIEKIFPETWRNVHFWQIAARKNLIVLMSEMMRLKLFMLLKMVIFVT